MGKNLANLQIGPGKVNDYFREGTTTLAPKVNFPREKKTPHSQKKLTLSKFDHINLSPNSVKR